MNGEQADQNTSEVTSTFGGYLFAYAWQNATDRAREQAARLATGAEWVGMKSDRIAQSLTDHPPTPWHYQPPSTTG